MNLPPPDSSVVIMAPFNFSLILLRLGTGGFTWDCVGVVVGFVDCFRMPFGLLFSSAVLDGVEPVLLVDFSFGRSDPFVNLFCLVKFTPPLCRSFVCCSFCSVLLFDSWRISWRCLGVDPGEELLSSVLDVC